jgi:galactokinase
MSSVAFVPEEVVSAFAQRFQSETEPALYRAPGRVNLIGEHTDYNLGFVFPIALEMACCVAVAPSKNNNLRIYSSDFDEEVTVPVEQIPNARPREKWSDYVVGVAKELAHTGVPIEGSNLWIKSEVPVGSGLSSSAALEIASAFAVLGSRHMNPLDIALLGQRAESQFVGMPCGIMDQYASVFGREGAAIRIDCRSLQHEYVPLPPELKIIAVNSMVKHELGTSAYRDRVAECQAAVAAIQAIKPDVKSLRDVTPAMFEEFQERIPPLPRRRARHIVTENQRVDDLAAAARAHELENMGKLFIASHRSMQHDYEISCEEIDFLVDHAITIPGVYGARMTGGGFGGCTVNLVDPKAVNEFRERLSAEYKERFNLSAAFYDCKPAPGAGPLVAKAPR